MQALEGWQTEAPGAFENPRRKVPGFLCGDEKLIIERELMTTRLSCAHDVSNSGVRDDLLRDQSRERVLLTYRNHLIMEAKERAAASTNTSHLDYSARAISKPIACENQATV